MAKEKIAVIGGGASGLCAAIYAKRNGFNVAIFESNSSLGKKLLRTGNGHCNFANADTKLTHYHSKNKEHVKSVFSKYPLNELLEFMNDIGVFPKLKDGLYYPNSMQAKSVRDCLEKEAILLGCDIFLDAKVNSIKRDGNRYIIDTFKGVFAFDKIIFANGGMAAPNSGSDGNGFYMAKSLGFTVSNVFPALCPLIIDDTPLKKSGGVRIDSNISLIINGKEYKESGNLQITDYGISGICTMQLSYLAAEALFDKKKVECKLDFIPDLSLSNLDKLICKKIKLGQGKTVYEMFVGLLPDKLINTILVKSNIRGDLPCVNIPLGAKDIIIKNIKEYSFNIINVKGFADAQSTYGGVCLDNIDKNTLLSKTDKNIGFCGEILDVCGDCGGYNLMWAISSGALVGKSMKVGK